MKRELFLAIIIILTLNFKTNVFNSSVFFNEFQHDGESMVIGRLINTQNNGFFHDAGLLGWTHPIPQNWDKYWYQYDSYRHNYYFDSYQTYDSHPGSQALIYGLLEKITGMKGNKMLQTLWWLVSFSTAMVFALFIFWVQRRWGWATAFFVLLSICFSQWVTAFGRNLFWVLGVFYLPFVTALWYLQKYETTVKHPYRITFWLMYATMLLKYLFTGFEFITTTAVMAITPWVFYEVMERWQWKKFFQRAATASAGIFAAIVSAIVLLAVQLSFIKGSMGEGFQYIFWSFRKRSYGGGSDISSMFTESVNSNLWDVLASYVNSYAVYIAHWFDFPLWKMMARVSFGYCIVLFAVVSYFVFTSQTLRLHPVFRRQQIALTYMLWVSFLAPLSWLVIFKGHAYIHLHMDPIVWHQPFMLLGATLTGSMLWFFFKTYRQSKSCQSNELNPIQ